MGNDHSSVGGSSGSGSGSRQGWSGHCEIKAYNKETCQKDCDKNFQQNMSECMSNDIEGMIPCAHKAYDAKRDCHQKCQRLPEKQEPKTIEQIKREDPNTKYDYKGKMVAFKSNGVWYRKTRPGDNR